MASNKKMGDKLYQAINTKDINGDESPYIVLVGNVGTGKSTILEKLTGVQGRASDKAASVTQTTEYFWVPDKSLIVADTPGTNPRKHKLNHSIEIASALNLRALSKIFIVVKADVRLDETVYRMKGLIEESFYLFPQNVLGIMITHMDVVKSWSQNQMREACKEDFGITDIVFSEPLESAISLQKHIMDTCGTKQHDLKIESTNFLRIFDFSKKKFNVIKVTQKTVDNFKALKQSFEEKKKGFSEDEQVDLFFAFKAFLEEMIDQSVKNVCNELGIDFSGTNEDVNMENASYIANMVNQIRVIVYDIRIQALFFHNDHDCNDLRACPHCGTVYVKVEGCEGSTRCGDLPFHNKKDFNRKIFEMANFTFEVCNNMKEIKIEKTGTKVLKMTNWMERFKDTFLRNSYTVDPNVKDDPDVKGPCGKKIKWREMKAVPTPLEFKCDNDKTKVSTEDILPLHSGAQALYDDIDKKIKEAQNRLHNKK